MLPNHTFPSPEAIKNAITELSGRLQNFHYGQQWHVEILTVIKRLIRKANVILLDWPVPVTENDSQELRGIIFHATSAIQTFLNTPNQQRSAHELLDTLETIEVDFEGAWIRALARNAQNEGAAERLRQLNELITQTTNTHDDLIQKSKVLSQKIAIKEQQGYFYEQARRFRGIAAWSLGTAVALIITFVLLLAQQDSVKIMKDYLDQEAELVVRSYGEHDLTKDSMGAAMDRFNTTCEGCMRTLFINTIIRANAVRIISVSFVLFLIAVALKAFYSGAHNYTINMQRSNSLTAALELFDKPVAQEAKDALLDKAASAIFTHQPSGFNSKPPSNMFQSLLDFAKSKKEA
ncbi:MAG: hypothetical protein JNN32_04440 [Flavobacteriales bacterium]|nr:hypothetical protein [Flavobacteriales bacterium]